MLINTTNWVPIEMMPPPDGLIVLTKIDDENGCRNIQHLKKSGNLWWTPDGSMYVYYVPTHWKTDPK